MSQPAKSRRSHALADDAPAAPSDSPGTVREVFLSPRVIDREAFNEFAGELRRLIEEARTETQTLRSTSAEARSAQDQLKLIAVKSQPKIDAVAKAIAALEDRTHRAEQVTDHSRQAEAAALAAPAGAVRAVDAAANQIDRRLEEFRTTLEARLASVAQDAHKSLDESQELLRQGEARLEERLRRGEELLAQRWAAMNSELNRMQAQAIAGAGSVDAQVRAQLDNANARLAEMTRGADERVIASWTHVDSLVERLNAAAQRAESLLGVHVSADSAVAPAPGNGSGPAVAEGTPPLAERGASSASPSDSPFTLAHVQHAISASQAATSAGEAIARQLQSLQDQAARTRELLGESILDAARAVDELTVRAAVVTADAERTITTCEATQARTARSLEALQATAAGPLREIQSAQSQVETLGTQLVQRINQSRSQAREACDEASMLLARLGELLGQLKPWSPLLLDAKQSEIPEPLKQLLASVRGELSSDLNTLAGALHELTARTITTARTISQAK